jgi:DNA (cytosine-5)-methyltransferase 1
MTQDPISSETHTPVLSANASIGVCLTGTVTHALTTRCAAAEEDGTGLGSPLIAPDETIVRRLTEMECERLQGYPDNWTDNQTASARYRQLGNSVAVPCVEWIARRLIAVDDQLRGDE